MEPVNIKLVDVLRITQPELEGEGVEESIGFPGTQPLLDNIVAAASSFFVRLLDRFTVADLVAPAETVGLACLDCNLVAGRPVRNLRAPAIANTNIAGQPVDDGLKTNA
jgi:Rrf2 family nitric oxide-sensitive transcriptional repressor